MTVSKEISLASSTRTEPETVLAQILHEIRETGHRWTSELSIISFLNRCERQYGSEIARRVAESSELRSLTSDLITV